MKLEQILKRDYKSNPRNIYLNEEVTSSAVSSITPENVIDVVYQDKERELEKPDNKPKSKLQERILLRRRLSQLLEKEENGESTEDDLKDLVQCRYALQKFTNGGTPYIDEEGNPQIDGDPDGDSSYEKWRYDINDKKRAARIEQDRNDITNIYASPHNTKQDYHVMLDNQEDAFLKDYIDKYGQI